MRLLYFLFISFFILSAGFAQSSNETILGSAQKHFDGKNYGKAIELYEGLVEKGYNSRDLYFNLATAYFEDKKLPESILYYEKVLKQKPYNKAALINLKIANDIRASDISPIPDFFLLQWWRNFSGVLSSLFWSLLGMISFGISIYFFWQYLFINSRKRYLSITILCGFLGFLLLLAARTNHKMCAKETHLINLKEIALLKGPDSNSGMEIEIPAGEKLKILDQIGEWVKVSLINKDEGWSKKSDLESI